MQLFLALVLLLFPLTYALYGILYQKVFAICLKTETFLDCNWEQHGTTLRTLMFFVFSAFQWSPADWSTVSCRCHWCQGYSNHRRLGRVGVRYSEPRRNGQDLKAARHIWQLLVLSWQAWLYHALSDLFTFQLLSEQTFYDTKRLRLAHRSPQLKPGAAQPATMATKTACFSDHGFPRQGNRSRCLLDPQDFLDTCCK